MARQGLYVRGAAGGGVNEKSSSNNIFADIKATADGVFQLHYKFATTPSVLCSVLLFVKKL